MKQYILNYSKGIVLATYSNAGKLKRLEAKKGFLVDAAKAGYSFGLVECDINQEHWKVHEPEKDAFFAPAQEAWMRFYTAQTGLRYRFTPTDGKALKEIGKYLTSISTDTSEAIRAWEMILKRWYTLDPFYSHKMQLTFINSQLNTIINLLKNGKQTSAATTRGAADDLRRSFES